MNYILLLIETILVLSIMMIFYKMGKKDGLFLYISLISSLLSLFMFKTIDVLSFEVDLGVPFVMGIFICSNTIIQRYGIDEIKKIIKSFVIPFGFITIILGIISLFSSSEYNVVSNISFNEIFGYNLDNIRLVIGILCSLGFTIWYNAYIYYYIKKNKNRYLVSNIGSMLVIQFLESIIFVLISYIGVFDLSIMFGMIVIRYLLKVVIGVIGLLPFTMTIKMKS